MHIPLGPIEGANLNPNLGIKSRETAILNALEKLTDTCFIITGLGYITFVALPITVFQGAKVRL
jgi:hypothetical protein